MTKRILSVLLALVLVLALAVPALAETPQKFTLTINDEADNRTYEAYQVFSGDYTKDNEGNDVLSNIEWGSGVVADADGKIGGQTAAQWEKALSEDNSLAKSFADLIGENLSTTCTPSAAGTDEYTFELEAGYYFVKETTKLANENDAASAFILNVVKTTDVDTKRSNIPTVEKTQDDADASYYVGEPIQFTLTAYLPSTNYDEYDEYFFEFEDTLSAGLDYGDSYEINVPGFEFAQNGKTLTWTCTNTKAEGVNLQAGTKIVITYTATLNSSAVSLQKETNTVLVEYSNDPENTGEGGSTSKTTPDTEIVCMIDLAGHKIDGANDKDLSGAKFVLLKDGKFYSKAADGTVSWENDITSATEVTSDGTGKFAFGGLGAGTYWLRETVAPSGYNKLESDIKITITSSIVNGEVVFETEDTEVIINESNAAIDVENNKGTILPSTGGMGTTLFYVVGGLLMAAAVVLLVAKKRTVNE